MSDPTLDAINDRFAQGTAQVAADGLRRLCLRYEPLTRRWYYELPAGFRAGLESQGYDADAWFSTLSAAWPDPNP